MRRPHELAAATLRPSSSPAALASSPAGASSSCCAAATVRATLRDLAKAPLVRTAVAAAAGAIARLTFVRADLTADDGWDDAMAGCDYVLHVASPLGGDASRDPDALIVPARDGTLRVLRAATKPGVKRVVMTSAAATARPPLDSNRIGDETVWADPSDRQFEPTALEDPRRTRGLGFHGRPGGTTSLATILPGAVFGPVLTKENLGSVQIHRAPAGGQPGRVRASASRWWTCATSPACTSAP